MTSLRAALGSPQVLLVFAAMIVGTSLPGCDSGERTTTGTQVTTPPEQIQANKNMEDFMKKGGASGAGAPQK